MLMRPCPRALLLPSYLRPRARPPAYPSLCDDEAILYCSCLERGECGHTTDPLTALMQRAVGVQRPLWRGESQSGLC